MQIQSVFQFLLEFFNFKLMKPDIYPKHMFDSKIANNVEANDSWSLIKKRATSESVKQFAG